MATHGLPVLFYVIHVGDYSKHIGTEEMWEHALKDTMSRHVATVSIQKMALVIIVVQTHLQVPDNYSSLSHLLLDVWKIHR